MKAKKKTRRTARRAEHGSKRAELRPIGLIRSSIKHRSEAPKQGTEGAPDAWLEMNPRDAQLLKLLPHAHVDIVSRRGRTSGVELRVTEMVAPGQVFMPFHFAETNVNQVTQSAFDPFSREPNYKQCAVRVEKTPPSSGKTIGRGFFRRKPVTTEEKRP